MNVANGISAAEIEQVVVAAYFAIPCVEARSAIAFFVELQAWIMVPMAPSSTRMRFLIRLRNSARGVVEVAFDMRLRTLRRVPSPRWGEG